MSEQQSFVTIKVRPNEDNPDVGAKYVGARDYATPKISRDGKVVTGIDEFAFEIINLPADERKKKEAEIKKIRENLQKVLGIADLSPDSNYWVDFMIILEDGITLEPSVNPLDQLHERFLVANRYVAPDQDSLKDDERFHGAMFYIYRKEEEVSKKAKLQRIADKATAALSHLDADEPNKLKMIASYLFGVDANIDMKSDEAYTKIKDFIQDPEHGKDNRDRFLEACGKTTAQLATKQVFDKAVKKRIISSRGGVYKRGDEIYGDSPEEALEFLLLPENSGELAYLTKAINREK